MSIYIRYKIYVDAIKVNFAHILMRYKRKIYKIIHDFIKTKTLILHSSFVILHESHITDTFNWTKNNF